MVHIFEFVSDCICPCFLKYNAYRCRCIYCIALAYSTIRLSSSISHQSLCQFCKQGNCVSDAVTRAGSQLAVRVRCLQSWESQIFVGYATSAVDYQWDNHRPQTHKKKRAATIGNRKNMTTETAAHMCCSPGMNHLWPAATRGLSWESLYTYRTVSIE